MPFQNNFRNAESGDSTKQLSAEKEIEKLAATLSGAQNQKTKIAAAEALCKIGGPAITRLISTLSQERWEVRSSTILALAKVGQPATQAFQAALRDQDWFVRAAAANSLGQIKDPRAVKSLINILNDKEWFVRERAAEALSKIGEPAVESLIVALKDRNGLVRERAAEALSKIGEPAVESLIVALKDRNGLVRERAAEVLGKIGNAKSVKPLLEAFHDEELYVRARAVLAYERVKTRSVEIASPLGPKKQS
jgi:HEAT repeat protein